MTIICLSSVRFAVVPSYRRDFYHHGYILVVCALDGNGFLTAESPDDILITNVVRHSGNNVWMVTPRVAKPSKIVYCKIFGGA